MNKEITVVHPNGYVGKLYGTRSMTIYRGTTQVLHTANRTINTKEELYEHLEAMPEFIGMMFDR